LGLSKASSLNIQVLKLRPHHLSIFRMEKVHSFKNVLKIASGFFNKEILLVYALISMVWIKHKHLKKQLEYQLT